MELEASTREVEEQMSPLVIKDERLKELEGVQTRLQATLEAEKGKRARQVKKDACKAQQKTPLEKNYLLSNSPGSVGPLKLARRGPMARSVPKRCRPETIKDQRWCKIGCTDSYLIKKVAQHHFSTTIALTPSSSCVMHPKTLWSACSLSSWKRSMGSGEWMMTR